MCVVLLLKESKFLCTQKNILQRNKLHKNELKNDAFTKARFVIEEKHVF